MASLEAGVQVRQCRIDLALFQQPRVDDEEGKKMMSFPWALPLMRLAVRPLLQQTGRLRS
jgi:hypothetical protein